MPELQESQMRRGLIKAPIGSNHVFRGKDGVNQQLPVRDMRVHVPTKKVVVCLAKECRGKEWKNESEMRAAHPPAHIMVKQAETHVFCWYSDDLCEDYQNQVKALAPHEIKPGMPTYSSSVEKVTLPIGLCSDEEQRIG